jgi:hypothetical protein
MLSVGQTSGGPVKRDSFERIAPLLEAPRATQHSARFDQTHFLLNGKEFLHFHDDGDGIVADAILSKGRISMPVNTTAEQAEFMDRIDGSLAALGSRKRDRHRRRRSQGKV